MLHLLIDADTGVDDSIAILYALLNPAVHVVGITTGFGNTTAEQAAENSLRLIRLADPGYEVPVVIGARGPLEGEWHGPEKHIHGDNGIGNAQLPAAEQKPLLEACSDFIHRMAEAYAGELVLVSLGRMTNLALALNKYPDLPKKLKRVVAMGGTVSACGNVSPCVEANVWGDPEAADQVFTSGLEVTMVGLDVTLKTRLHYSYLDGMARYCRADRMPILNYLREALDFYMRFSQFQEGSLENCPLHDPLAMMAAVKPELFTTRRMKARVECGGKFCRGMVVTDLRLHPIEAEYVEFCLDVDSDQAIRELFSVFCGNEPM